MRRILSMAIASLLVAAPTTAIAQDAAVSTWVTGQAEWLDDLASEMEEVHPDGTRSSRGAVYGLGLTADDPRLEGYMEWGGEFDEYGGKPETDGDYVHWGSVSIQNGGGSWVGTSTGVSRLDGCWTQTAWLSGVDGYADHSAYLDIRSCDEDDFSTFEALIFPGEPPSER